MLYIDEEIGAGTQDVSYPDVDIAVDRLEGTNLCAMGANNAITLLAAAERGGLLHAPDIYMKDYRRPLLRWHSRHRRSSRR